MQDALATLVCHSFLFLSAVRNKTVCFHLAGGSSNQFRMVCEVNCEVNNASCAQVFFDISVDGEPIGRFVVGLYGNDAPVGTARFADLGEPAQVGPSLIWTHQVTSIVKSMLLQPGPQSRWFGH
jgi:hypothetical protein